MNLSENVLLRNVNSIYLIRVFAFLKGTRCKELNTLFYVSITCNYYGKVLLVNFLIIHKSY